jgi:hypothetical protein
MYQKATKMAMLVSRITTTFAEDAGALIAGFGSVILRVVTAPVERIANTDVAGILAERRAASRMWRTERKRMAASKRRGGLFRCLSFRYLADLT